VCSHLSGINLLFAVSWCWLNVDEVRYVELMQDSGLGPGPTYIYRRLIFGFGSVDSTSITGLYCTRYDLVLTKR